VGVVAGKVSDELSAPVGLHDHLAADEANQRHLWKLKIDPVFLIKKSRIFFSSRDMCAPGVNLIREQLFK
jgi:hypothetical protein